MPILSTAAENSSLDNDYGATKGPNAAAAHQVALFMGDPMVDGVEVPDTTETEAAPLGAPNGYERVVLTNDGTTWPAASDGQKLSLIVAQFPDALEAYPGTVTHAVLYDDADGVTGWDCFPLLEPLDVTEAGDGPAVSLCVFYSDSVTAE